MLLFVPYWNSATQRASPFATRGRSLGLASFCKFGSYSSRCSELRPKTFLPLQGVEFATLSTADPQCSDLLKDTEHIEQTVFFGNLALNNPVKGRADADNGLPGRGDPKK